MYFYYSTLFCQKNQSSSLFFSIQVVDKISLAQLTLFLDLSPISRYLFTAFGEKVKKMWINPLITNKKQTELLNSACFYFQLTTTFSTTILFCIDFSLSGIVLSAILTDIIIFYFSLLYCWCITKATNLRK